MLCLLLDESGNGEKRNEEGGMRVEEEEVESEVWRDWKGEVMEILERTGVGKAENMRWKSEGEGGGTADESRNDGVCAAAGLLRPPS